MAITLFDLAYRTAAKLGNLREGEATGGSTTTVVDNTIRRQEDQDYFNGGTVFIVKTTDGAAPQGEFSVVSDYNSSSKTITALDAFTVAVGAGDEYAVNNSRFPLWLLVQKINDAVHHLGLIPTVDTSTITTATDQREYTLPQAASLDLRTVEWATELDADRNIWTPVLNWDIEYSAGGAAEKLILAYDLPDGYKLKLQYGAMHADLRAYNDVLNEVVHPDTVVYQAAAECLQWYMDKTRLKDFQQTYEILLQKAERARAQYPLPPLPSKQRKVLLVNPSRLTSSTAYDQD